ncbi:MAG: hypothetical protein Q9164_004974 [Protoblastenia rupestris]
MASGSVIVERALNQLKSTLSDEDTRFCTDASLEDVRQEARRIEKEQGARGDLLFMRRIEPMCRSLESYAGILEVFCQGYPPMAFIWGPIKLMLRVSHR